jgi:glycosyltransferase involved in cell wall biosynthesis
VRDRRGGAERQRLEFLIRKSRLEGCVTLLGHVAQTRMGSLYRRADVVVLTSRSEGIPLVLMEAMARGGIVLAPAITGISEIVIPGKTGFLYAPGSLQDFVTKIFHLQRLIRDEDRFAVSRLDWMRHAGRVHVLHNFSHRKNLTQFGDLFVQRTATQNSTNQTFTSQDFANQDWSSPHEDLVLQQI